MVTKLRFLWYSTRIPETSKGNDYQATSWNGKIIRGVLAPQRRSNHNNRATEVWEHKIVDWEHKIEKVTLWIDEICKKHIKSGTRKMKHDLIEKTPTNHIEEWETQDQIKIVQATIIERTSLYPVEC